MENNSFKLYCCGSRGSRPVEGIHYVEFGGYTTCYILKKDSYALIIDCGTGLYEAGPIIADCTKIDIVLTHVHYDHILGLLEWSVFPQNVEITFYGSFDEWLGKETIKEFFKKPFWPVAPSFNLKQIPKYGKFLCLDKGLRIMFYPAPHPDDAHLMIIYLTEETQQDDIQIEESNNADSNKKESNIKNNELNYIGKISIMFDNELPTGLPKEDVEGSDLLLYDGMFDDSEYPGHEGWGHSTWQMGVKLAKETNVKRLIITHHDTRRTDARLREFENKAREEFPKTDFAHYGQSWDFPEYLYSQNEEAPESAEELKKKSFTERITEGIQNVFNTLSNSENDSEKLATFKEITLYAILSCVSGFMTIVNLFTQIDTLMISTLLFTILYLLNIVLLVVFKLNHKVVSTIAQVEGLLLLTSFLIIGDPEGFSALWALLLPAGGMFIFGRKRASTLCATMLAILVFFLDTGIGRSFLQYQYTESFMLRFPMAFAAFSLLAYLLESIRMNTMNNLNRLKAEQEAIIKQQTIEIRDQNMELWDMNSELQMRNISLRKSFGTLVPTEVVSDLLDTTTGDAKADTNAEKVQATVLQSDIRGFTALCNRLGPLEIVNMLNHYLKAMTDIVKKHNGNVIEFMGDGILAIFGAPTSDPFAADNAIACAIEMQASMKDIAGWNEANGYPKFEIGIGVNSGEVVTGLIGSEKHLKYDVIGRVVNICSRVETYSTGGQIIVTDDTIKLSTSKISIPSSTTIAPKGIDKPITVHYVDGIGKPYNISCRESLRAVKAFEHPVDMSFVLIENNHCDFLEHAGKIIGASSTNATLMTDAPLDLFDNIRLNYKTGVVCKVISIKPCSDVGCGINPCTGNKEHCKVCELRYTSTPTNFDIFRSKRK